MLGFRKYRPIIVTAATFVGCWLGLTSLLIISSRSANAQAVFSNFGSGNSYDVDNHWAVKALPFGSGDSQILAVAFTPSVDATLKSAEAALGIAPNSGGDSDFIAHVVGDDNGLPNIDNLIDSAMISITERNIYQFTFDANAALIGNTPYWLIITPDNLLGEGAGYWYWNNIGETGLAYNSNFINSWQFVDVETPAYSINGSVGGPVVVPEAGTLTLSLSAVGIGVVMQRRRKKTV